MFPLTFFGNFLSACLTTGRNHRFSYPPFLFSPSSCFGVFPFVVSLRPLADFPRPLFICSSVYSPLIFERNEHFLFRSFFLYLYYNRKSPFVNRFFKNFLLKLKIFFNKRKDGRIIFYILPSTLQILLIFFNYSSLFFAKRFNKTLSRSSTPPPSTVENCGSSLKR